MSDRYKLPQPYRNPGDFKAYLDGVKATVKVVCPELSVHAIPFGGGIPIDLTIYDPRAEYPIISTALPKAEPDPEPNTALFQDVPDVAETVSSQLATYAADAETADTGDAPDAAADTQ